MKKFERTTKSFEFDVADIFHFTGGDYKPWWSPVLSYDRSARQIKKTTEFKIKGYNSAFPEDLVGVELEECTEDGRIVKKDSKGRVQNYLVEINVKVTKLKQIK